MVYAFKNENEQNMERYELNNSICNVVALYPFSNYFLFCSCHGTDIYPVMTINYIHFFFQRIYGADMIKNGYYDILINLPFHSEGFSIRRISAWSAADVNQTAINCSCPHFHEEDRETLSRPLYFWMRGREGIFFLISYEMDFTVCSIEMTFPRISISQV